MKTQHITLHDIAELTSITKVTVSRYLRTPEKVKLETAERIASVIAKIGHQPDPGNPVITNVAVSWVGVLIPSLRNQIFVDLLVDIKSVAAGHGYQTLMVSYDYDRQRKEEQIAAVLAFNVKGLLLTESVHPLRTGKYLNTTKIPIAEMMGLMKNLGRINVGFDSFQAGFDMTTMLLASDKRRIIYFDSMSGVRDEQHYLGYCRTMEDAGLAVGRIAPSKVSSVSTGIGMMTLVRQIYADMDDILYTNDNLAVGMSWECLASGINMPQELAIAGSHGLEIGQIVPSRLVSALTPHFEMGRMAIETLIKKIEGLPTVEKVGLYYRLSMGEAI